MTTTDAWTIGRLLTWTTDFLKRNGSQSARLDAEVLLSHALGCQRIELYTAFESEPSEEAKTAFREMVRRRSEGTPVAYLVGYKEFYSDTFEVNPDVLIPRPETEHLVVEALDRIKELRQGSTDFHPHIADIGTGSGIIAITLAKAVPDSEVVAIDLSSAALELARRNAKKLQVAENQLQFLESDLLAKWDGAPFDLIVSNPPYVSESEFTALDRTVRDFEPRMALVSGPSGSEIIVQIMQQALPHLRDSGFLILEASPMLFDRMDQWLPSGWRCVKLTKDLAGLGRVATFQKHSSPTSS